MPFSGNRNVQRNDSYDNKKEGNLRVVSLLINIVMSQTMQLSNRMSKALAP